MDEQLEQIRKAEGFDEFVDELLTDIDDESAVPVPALVLRLLAPDKAQEKAVELESDNDIVRSYRALMGLGV